MLCHSVAVCAKKRTTGTSLVSAYWQVKARTAQRRRDRNSQRIEDEPRKGLGRHVEGRKRDRSTIEAQKSESRKHGPRRRRILTSASRRGLRSSWG